MSKYKAVIFDLDGVICSTDEYHYLAWKELANKIGIYDYSKEDNLKQRGVSRMDSLEILLLKSKKKYSDEEKFQLANYKNELYKKYLDNLSPDDLSNDVTDTLNILKQNNILCAVGSSSKNTKFILKKIGLENFFDVVVDGNMIIHSKPDPEVFEKAVSLLKLKPCDCLVVEDAVAGIMSAYNGKIDSAGIKDAQNCQFVTYKINKISDILNIIIN